VDDEKSMREFLEIMLTQEGYGVALAHSGETACQLLENEPYGLNVCGFVRK